MTDMLEHINEGEVPQWTLGDRLAKARVTAGMSQAGMAEMLDCSINSIGRWENGALVRRGTVMNWALITGVPYTWLMTGVEPALRSRCFSARPLRLVRLEAVAA